MEKGGTTHQWLKLELSDRQKYIRHLLASKDDDHIARWIKLVRAPRGYGVYASIGSNYQWAVFGRDSIEVAEDVLTLQPALVKEIIFLLASLQGVGLDLTTEEEQGKIHHECRLAKYDNHVIPATARLVLEKLKAQWGIAGDDLLYYGSLDATPLFVRLVHRYCVLQGTAILGERILGRDGHRRTLHDHVRLAVGWLTTKLTASPWQMLEFKRLNPIGLYNQSWEDSNPAFLHADGTLARSDNGVAALEIQGYVYDALRGAADIVALDEQEASDWRHLASIVRDSTLRRMWLPKDKFFAMGLDRTDEGTTGQIATHSANAGALLESNLLSLLPASEAWPYVQGVVRRLMSEDFLTPAGLRLRSKRHLHLVDYADYHGSQVTWPKATFDAAKGLRKHGFTLLATVLEDRILQAVAEAGEFYEFFMVNKHNAVKYHYRREAKGEPSLHEFGEANIPDAGQAWTIAAVMAIVHRRRHPEPHMPPRSNVQQLEDEILAMAHIKNSQHIKLN